MNKIKTGFLLITTIMVANLIKAQSIEDGKKFLYYTKYISAKNVFQKLVNADPNNVDAVYWLGQTLIAQEDKDIAGAKALYQKTLMANSNSPLLTAAMGHIELLEGKTQDARNRFETAISLSQGKNIAVLNAIGFANADYDSKDGDASYAIDKLKLATTIKGFKDPETYCIMGDAYRKFADGGNAQKSYEAALAIAPSYARAKYRIGKIYQTQGYSQEEIYMRYNNEAIALDPSYIPVYFNLHQYFYNTNVGKSAEYLDKYLNLMGDDEPNACFYRASMKYAQGLFQEAITKSDECIAAGGATPFSNLYGLKAYAYYKLGDWANSKLAFDLYFQKQKAEKLGPNDYQKYAEVLLKTPGNEATAATFVQKAVDIDSTEAGKVSLLKAFADTLQARKNYTMAADWYKKILSVKKNPGKIDLYNTGYNYNKGGNYQQSIDIFNQYILKFPDESFGYYMNARNSLKLDSTDAAGNGLANYVKIVSMADLIKDKPGERDRIKNSLRYLIEFYANVKKDKQNALLYSEKGIALDPADSEFVSIKEQISKMNMNAPPPRANQTTVGRNGEKITVGADGTISTIFKDGSSSIVTKSGKVTTIKGGVTTIVENGKVTTIDKDGKTTTVSAPAKNNNKPPKKK